MAEHGTEGGGHGGGHETSDVSARPVVAAGFILLLFVGVVSVAMDAYMKVVAPPLTGASLAAPAAEATPAPDSPAYPIEDWRRVADEARGQLAHTGWVDKQKRIVHMPIERAMELIASEGLPTRPQPAGGTR